MSEVDLHPIVQDVAKLMSLVDGRVLFHDADRQKASMLVMATLPDDKETIAIHLIALANKCGRIGGKNAASAVLVLLQLVVDLVNDQVRAADMFKAAGLGDMAEQLLGVRADLKAPRAEDMDRSLKPEVKPKRGLR